MILRKEVLGKNIEEITEREYRGIIEGASEALENRNLVKKDWEEFFVVGDTHGRVESAKNPAERALENDIPIAYLGDYVDRGEEQLETLAYVLSLKKENPEQVILLRGNHETERMNHSYGFYRVANLRYSDALYRKIVDLYERLPVGAVIGNTYFLVHGGIPKGINSLDELERLDHDEEAYSEIFWNDPSEDIKRFEPNFRRGGYQLYGEEAVSEFLESNSLSTMIRAHEVQPEGYRYYFDEKLLSIFSVSNYRGGNLGKYAHVNGPDIELIDNP